MIEDRRGVVILDPRSSIRPPLLRLRIAKEQPLIQLSRLVPTVQHLQRGRFAAQRGFAVRLLSDLVGYVRRDLAEPALHNLGLYFAEVTSSDGVAAELTRSEKSSEASTPV